MSPDSARGSSRRTFLQNTGKVAAATALAGTIVPKVHAAENNTIQLALVGCGGRGTGAVGDALANKHRPTKLVAMADVLPEKLSSSYANLTKEHGDKINLSDDRKFVGFDGYRKAMDCLNPGDIVLLTSPVAFRWVHFTYAIERGLNVFMEKPISVDGPTARKMFALGELAKTKNLKVAVGLMCRHCKARQNLHERIQDGAIGDITMLRAYRMSGPTAKEYADPRPKEKNELLWQIEWFHSFLWASGGAYSDFLIHNIDESCWMKNAWPISAQASGGRHYRGDKVDQNFDSYSVEYTFADGAKLMLGGRGIPGCKDEFASFAHGTKGSAIISTSAHHPAKCRIYKGQKFVKDEMTWMFPQPEPNPYKVEWDDFVEAIVHDRLYNEVKRGTEASLVTSMGRMAAHTGQVITWDDMLNCKHEFAPNVDKLTMESPAPIVAGPDGKYPVPQPGLITKTEF